MTHKRFPPRIGHVFVPLSSRTDAIAGLGLHSPSRLRSRLVQYAGYLTILTLGPSALPGPVSSVSSLLPTGDFDEIIDAWRVAAGDYDAVALHRHPQSERSGFAVLLIRDGSAIAFAKVDDEPTALRWEHRALTIAARQRLGTFSIPDTLGLHVAAGWTTLVLRPLPFRFHRSAFDLDVDTICTDISTSLSGLPRSGDVPGHWQPMHGDLAPWNVRRSLPADSGPPHVIDWEDAGWGPPYADAVYYQAARAALRSASATWTPDHDEAREYWLQVVRHRQTSATSARDAVLTRALTTALTQSRARG